MVFLVTKKTKKHTKVQLFSKNNKRLQYIYVAEHEFYAI